MQENLPKKGSGVGVCDVSGGEWQTPWHTPCILHRSWE